MKAFHAASRQDHPAELVEIITGESNIRSRTDQLPDAAREQIRGFDRPPYVMSPDEDISQEASRIREGVSYRIIYSAQAVMWPGRLEGEIRDACAAGEQARVRPDLPTKLWIVDDTMALIPIKSAQQAIATCFIVRPCDLLDSLIALFEAEWERALPLRAFLGEDPVRPGHGRSRRDQDGRPVLPGRRADRRGHRPVAGLQPAHRPAPHPAPHA